MMNIPRDFLIGTSSSAWQIEGCAGKGENQKSWAELFYETDPGRWAGRIGPEVACDFYHRYEEDIATMAEHGMNAFRFTIQWARFMEDPLLGTVSEAGAAFYGRVIDCIVSHGMEPVISLEHWDIPAVLLEKFDGWVGRETVELYEIYVKAALERYGRKVKLWFAFTEPGVPIDNGYLEGRWYPFRCDPRAAYQAHFHKVLATARAVRAAQPYQQYGCRMGAMIHLTPVYPRSDAPGDREAAFFGDLLQVRLYLDPYLRGEYPEELLGVLREHGCMFRWEPEDLRQIRQYRIQVLGADYYYPIRVKQRTEPSSRGSFHPDYYYETWEMPGREFNADRGWEIYPEAIVDFGNRIKQDYGNIPWFISENGLGIANEGRFRNSEGMIEDDYRIDFIRRHLTCALRARESGSNCFGYLIWSFIDNLSPINAFKNRYGLLELDLDTCQRRPKKSLLWLRDAVGEGRL